MKDIPLLTVAATASTYWSCVAMMVVRSRIKFRSSGGAIPRTPWEQLMWLVWAPNTAAWLILPWLAWDVSDDHAPWAALALPHVWSNVLRWTAALMGVLAFCLTTRCWLAMGSNWSMAIDPERPPELLTRGPFGLVRHPIYALSILLMICTVVVVGTLPMTLVGIIHIVLTISKAANEEYYLERLHGESYRSYRQATRRFVPWRRRGSKPRSH